MTIRTQDKDGVRTIAFARAEKKNAITSEMYEKMVQALASAQEDDRIKVVLFASTNENFTAGNDVGDFAANPPTGPDAPVFQLLKLLCEVKKPMVAAVPGLAIGIGTTLLLHCDLVHCSPSADATCATSMIAMAAPGRYGKEDTEPRLLIVSAISSSACAIST